MLLHKECLPAQLAETQEQLVIAATFNDCNGVALTPGTRLLKCDDVVAPAPQTLSLYDHTLSLSGGGGSVTLPDNDGQEISIDGNVISLTNGGSVTLPTSTAPVPQVLSIYGDTVSLSGGGGSINLPTAPGQDPYATPAQTVAGTATALIVNPADLYARENIPAQTGLSNDVTAIPAPTAGQSPWGVNGLGETLHYAPGLGWKIVDNQWHGSNTLGSVATVSNVATVLGSITAPRDGLVVITSKSFTQTPIYVTQTSGIAINGVVLGSDNNGSAALSGNSSAAPGAVYAYDAVQSSGAVTTRVTAGDIITVIGLTLGSAGTGTGLVRMSYIGS